MKSLHSKLLAFRSDAEAIKKDANNPFFKSKYADLPSILAEIKPLMKRHGLSITHGANFIGETLVLTTTLCDTETGEIADSIFPLFGQKPQDVGSSMTYARRYNIQALLDLATEDDDGNSANTAPAITKQKFEENDNPWLNDKDISNIEEQLEAGEIISKSALKADWKISKVNQEKIVALIAKYPNQFVA